MNKDTNANVSLQTPMNEPPSKTPPIRRPATIVAVAAPLDPASKAGANTGIMAVAVGIVVMTTNTLMPTLVGVYADHYGLSVAEAGYTAAIYMAGGGSGAALVSWLLPSISTRILLAVSLCTLAIGNFASVFTHSVALIFTIRFIAGLGEGAGFALMGAAVSRLRDPNRIFGIFTVLLLLISSGIHYVIPWLRDTYGAQLFFLPIAVAPACLLAFIGWFPNLALHSDPILNKSSPEFTETRGEGSYFWCGIAATLVVYIAFGAGFAYIERMGVHAGIAANSVAEMIGMGYLIGAGGACVATLMSTAPRRAWRISVALIIVALSMLLTVTDAQLPYRIGVIMFFFSWSYFAPTFLGLMALADPRGQLAAAVTGAQEWGIAVGPAIAAFWTGTGNYKSVALIGACGFLGGLFLVIPVLRRVRQNEYRHHKQTAGLR